MKLSTTCRYGVRAVVDIAMYQKDSSVSISSISKRQNISTKYLEYILNPLKKGGLLTSTRGLKGGYSLAKDASLITPGDVVRLLDPEFIIVDCMTGDHGQKCKRISSCSTQGLWKKLKEALDSVLDSVTIQDLASQQFDLNKLMKLI